MFRFPSFAARSIGAAFTIAVAGAAAPAQEQAQGTELQDLNRELDDLRSRVAELESRPGAQLGTPPQVVVGPIRDRGNLNDNQTPAARYDNFALDPELRGFFPVFGSSMLFKFNAKPRVDGFVDDTYPGNEDRFVPAHFPLPGDPQYGGGSHFNMTTNATQLSFEVRDPENPSGFRFYYQNDFFAEQNTNNKYRLQHAYGQNKNIVAGFTYGVFEDPDIWPDTVDYEGPNALIFARRPLVHFKTRMGEELVATFGLEQPDIYLDTTAAPTTTLGTALPDAGFNVRWERGGSGHAQASVLLRSIGVHGGGIAEQEVFAWGANLSLGLQLTEADDLGFLVVGGEGIGGLGNDTSFLNSDAASDSNGDLVALPYASGMLSFRHRWNEIWRSTATYGYVSLDSVDGQAGSAYETSQYASLNLIWAFRKQASVGLEVLYGDKEVRDGRDADVWRVQMGLLYWLI